MHKERYKCAKVNFNVKLNAYAQALLEWISMLNVKCRPIAKIRSDKKPLFAIHFMTYAAARDARLHLRMNWVNN